MMTVHSSAVPSDSWLKIMFNLWSYVCLFHSDIDMLYEPDEIQPVYPGQTDIK